MPFSRERLLRDCRLAADALECARLGNGKALEDRLHELWDSQIYRNHHLSAESERDLFKVREPGLVVPVKRLDAAITITRKATDRLLAEHREGRSSLVRLVRAATALRVAIEGVEDSSTSPAPPTRHDLVEVALALLVRSAEGARLLRHLDAQPEGRDSIEAIAMALHKAGSPSVRERVRRSYYRTKRTLVEGRSPVMLDKQGDVISIVVINKSQSCL